MAKPIKPLKDAQLIAAKPKECDYSLYDGGGLIFLVRKSGTKTWRFKYKSGSSSVVLTLGAYPALSLQAARDKRREFETLQANGLDPKEQIEFVQVKKDNAHSLEKVARAWHEKQTLSEQWSSDTGHKTMRKFENHLFPIIGQMPVDEIEPRHVTHTLKTIDNKGVNRVARDIRAHLIKIFSYAIQEGYAQTNPAREMDGLIVVRKKNIIHN